MASPRCKFYAATDFLYAWIFRKTLLNNSTCATTRTKNWFHVSHTNYSAYAWSFTISPTSLLSGIWNFESRNFSNFLPPSCREFEISVRDSNSTTLHVSLFLSPSSVFTVRSVNRDTSSTFVFPRDLVVSIFICFRSPTSSVPSQRCLFVSFPLPLSAPSHDKFLCLLIIEVERVARSFASGLQKYRCQRNDVHEEKKREREREREKVTEVDSRNCPFLLCSLGKIFLRFQRVVSSPLNSKLVPRV